MPKIMLEQSIIASITARIIALLDLFFFVCFLKTFLKINKSQGSKIKCIYEVDKEESKKK